jgi:hypothetical protein
MKTNYYRSRQSGEGALGIVIILILLIGGGLYWLLSHKQAMDKEGRGFGRDSINRVVMNYDAAFLANALSPQAKIDLPPSDQQQLFATLRQLGQPAQPLQIEENFTWEKVLGIELFEPRGFFTVHLNYPGGAATLQLAVDHPVGRWEIINLTFQPPSTAR